MWFFWSPSPSSSTTSSQNASPATPSRPSGDSIHPTATGPASPYACPSWPQGSSLASSPARDISRPRASCLSTASSSASLAAATSTMRSTRTTASANAAVFDDAPPTSYISDEELLDCIPADDGFESDISPFASPVGCAAPPTVPAPLMDLDAYREARHQKQTMARPAHDPAQLMREVVREEMERRREKAERHERRRMQRRREYELRPIAE